jgi:NADH-quinone oxidoreductase subunit N
MYITEPHDPSPVHISGPMKAVIYVGLAGTLFIGIYPQPAADWVVAATMMFADVGGTAVLPSAAAAISAGP